MKKVLRVFRKDAKIATRDVMLIYIIIIPILFAIGILMFIPGLTDSSIKLAMLDNDPDEYIEYMESYAQVEVFSSMDELERRVLKQDDIVATIIKGDSYEVIIEGNENEAVLSYAELLNTQYELGATKEMSTAEMFTFQKIVPPLKTNLANMLILMVIMLSGMIIALGIVEEKADNTISAMNVTPVTQSSFILGKSLLGGFVALASIVVSLLILGYTDINWFMIILVGLTTMILTIVVGLLQGISSSDVIEAAAGVKMMMLPIAGSIAGYELLADKWQWTMYWSPFYWSYKANDRILSESAVWSEILLYTALVFIISMLVYILVMPKIRKGLSKT